MFLTRIKRSLGAFLIALTIGSFGGLLFWILLLSGKLRVRGYWRVMRQVARGNTIIVANHPTLLETVLLPVMFWPWAVFWPQRFFPWSVPDSALFPPWLQWLYDVAHCVKVDRTKTTNTDANRLMISILRNHGTLIIHPEAGRTGSEFRGKRPPKKRFGQYHRRKIRRIVTKVPAIARNTQATIVPVWVDIPFWQDTNGFRQVLWHWLSGRDRIVLSVGIPYKVRERLTEHTPDPGATTHADNKQLGSRLLRAGLE